MPRNYGSYINQPTPQSQPIFGRESEMKKNNAGGYSFSVDHWTMLDRFLILGAEGNTYYASERQMTLSNVHNLLQCISDDGSRVVTRATQMVLENRVPKRTPALFTLSLISKYGDVRAQSILPSAISIAARTLDDLTYFVSEARRLRGWGPVLRKTVANWYNSRTPEDLSYALAKYVGRNGWTNADLLRVSHPVPSSQAHNALYRWAVGKPAEGLTGMVLAKEALARVTRESDMVELITHFRAPREIVPTHWLKSKNIWKALLPHMGITALLRNLANLSEDEILAYSNWDVVDLVCNALENPGNQRVHPIQYLQALMVYSKGSMVAHGKSKLWSVVPHVLTSLENGMYNAFKNVKPTGKTFYYGVDVSSSMRNGSIAAIEGLSPALGAAVMAMALARTEKHHIIRGFTGNMVDLGITPATSLSDALDKVQLRNFGSTNAAIPIRDAMANNIPVDAFVIITDNETWGNGTHVSQLLNQYRQKFGRPTKLIAIGMTATEFTVTDPKDAGSLNVAGFDAAAPQLIADFAAQGL